MRINFRTDKIADLFQNKGVILTGELKNSLIEYYSKNYDRVRTNIIDDELVGFEYHNLCTIEEIVPKVKELRMCCR